MINKKKLHDYAFVPASPQVGIKPDKDEQKIFKGLQILIPE